MVSSETCSTTAVCATVYGRLRLANAAQVGSEEPLDGSFDRIFDAHFDGRDTTARLLRPKSLLRVHHPRYAQSRYENDARQSELTP